MAMKINWNLDDRIHAQQTRNSPQKAKLKEFLF